MSDEQPDVVVGVDGSAESRAALCWAVGQARRTGGRVAAIAVSEPRRLLAPGAGMAALPPGGGMAAGIVPAPADVEDLSSEAARWLSDAVEALPAGAAAAVETRVARGDAAEVLLEAARDAGLLVLGNHGRGALMGALTASVAQHCTRHAPCPLVLVPARGPTVADHV